MSKPNLLSVSFSVGFYRNKRVRELRKKLLESIPETVKFGDLAPMFFQALMAYAGENQIDGDFSTYDAEQLSEVFTTNNLPVTAKQAGIIQKAFAEVGLTEGGKIRSWCKFNRHLGEHEKIVKAKRKAAHMMHKKREADQKAATKAATNGNGHTPPPSVPVTEAKEPAKAKPAKELNPVARLMAIKSKKQNHPGAPNAANAPNDRDDLRFAQAEYRAFSKAEKDLETEIAGVRV